MIRTVLCVVVIVAFCRQLTGADASPQRVILIQADDLGFDDLGVSGNTLVRTPNLDRLAQESVQAVDFTVNPVCAPSRATLLTGRHFLRTGVSHVHGGKDYLHPSEKTVADVFAAAGWHTAMWGKWHLGTGPGYEPWDRGFQTAARTQLYRHEAAVFTEPTGTRLSHAWADVALVDEAIRFLDANPHDRAFLYLASMTPHGPLRAPREMSEPYRRAGLSDQLAELYGMVSLLDEQVGRLLAFLDERGLARDTLVVFTSDNGPALNRGEISDADRRLRKIGGQRGWKGDLWQAGVRAPLFVRWPAGLRPGVIATPLDQVDLLPTVAAWCGVRLTGLPYPLDGHDVGRLFIGAVKDPEGDRLIFNHAHPGWITSQRAYSPQGLPGEYNPVNPGERSRIDAAALPLSVRRGRFKLLRNPDPPAADGAQVRRTVLVDLFEDPGEAVDVSALFPDARRELEVELDAWFAGVREVPHAFSAPIHRVGSAGAEISARTPSALLGRLQNTVPSLNGWEEPGSAASYTVSAEQEHVVEVELIWNTAPTPERVFTLSITPGDAVAVEVTGPTWRTVRTLVLPAGESVLKLTAIGPAASAEAALTVIRVRPVAPGVVRVE